MITHSITPNEADVRVTNRILVVEDDRDAAELIEIIFRKHHINNEVDFMSDGVKALEYLRINTPTLILLDLKLPRVDGLQVLEKLRSNPKTRGIPVVVLTVSSDLEDIQRAFDLGARDYLVKPFKFEDLIAVVARLGGLSWTLQRERTP